MDSTTFQIIFADLSILFPDIDVSPTLPLAQAVLESANFKSHVFEQHNNCFGMEAPNKRETTCTNKGSGQFANYNNVYDCLKDYYLFLRNRGAKTDELLAAVLKKPASQGGYAADPNYWAKVSKQALALQKADKYIAPAVIKVGTGAVLALAVAAAAKGVVELVDV